MQHVEGEPDGRAVYLVEKAEERAGQVEESGPIVSEDPDVLQGDRDAKLLGETEEPVEAREQRAGERQALALDVLVRRLVRGEEVERVGRHDRCAEVPSEPDGAFEVGQPCAEAVHMIGLDVRSMQRAHDQPGCRDGVGDLLKPVLVEAALVAQPKLAGLERQLDGLMWHQPDHVDGGEGAVRPERTSRDGEVDRSICCRYQHDRRMIVGMTREDARPSTSAWRCTRPDAPVASRLAIGTMLSPAGDARPVVSVVAVGRRRSAHRCAPHHRPD